MNNKEWEKKQTLKERAKQFRKNPTPQEKLLWQSLRRRRLGGYYFRRQYVIDPFIVDFCCVKVRVVVELEGSVHDQQREYDHHRSVWLQDRGYTVLRFSNSEVEKNLELVLGKIMRVCEDSKVAPPRSE